MSVWKLVRLSFGRSPCHFGELGIGMEVTAERVRSDTLFSAWISTYARLHGSEAVETLLEQMGSESKPPFRISSTFLFQRKGDQVVYYLPRLLELPNRYPSSNDMGFAKVFRKLLFLPLQVWQRWYQQEGFTEEDQEELVNRTRGKTTGPLQQAGTFDYANAYTEHIAPRIAVDRVNQATNYFQTGFTYFQWDQASRESLSGLYFLIQFQSKSGFLPLKAALEFLGEEGMGGERSSGAGRFTVEWLDLPADWQQLVHFSDPNRYGLISLFWQKDLGSDLITPQTCYVLQKRGGWVTSPSSGWQQRRRTLQMFGEGSVFPVIPSGQLADVTPPGFERSRGGHKIYRSGIAMSLPVRV